MAIPATQLPSASSRLAVAVYLFLAALAGVLTGLVGSAFHLLITQLSQWPQRLAEYFSGSSLVIAAAVVTMLCSLFAVFIVRRFAPEAGGSGVQEIEGAMEGLRPMHWLRVLLVKFSMGVTAISSGLALGREGPTIHIGAALSAAVCGLARVDETRKRAMLAAGAAAGLSCAFNAPLASVIFVTEETRKQFPYSLVTYLAVIIAVICSTIVTRLMSGSGPMMAVSALAPDMTLLPLFFGLGVVVALVGVLLNASILKMLAFADRFQSVVSYGYPALIGLIVGALVILMPQAVTGGEDVITQLAAQPPALQAIVVLAVLRFASLVGSYSSGTPGGVFAPMLTLAICVGLAFGHLSEMLLPQAQGVGIALGVAAMGGLFAASIRSPMVGVILTLELTGSYDLILPLMLTCMTAHLFAQALGGRPLYEQLLERTLAKAAKA